VPATEIIGKVARHSPLDKVHPGAGQGEDRGPEPRIAFEQRDRAVVRKPRVEVGDAGIAARLNHLAGGLNKLRTDKKAEGAAGPDLGYRRLQLAVQRKDAETNVQAGQTGRDQERRVLIKGIADNQLFQLGGVAHDDNASAFLGRLDGKKWRARNTPATPQLIR